MFKNFQVIEVISCKSKALLTIYPNRLKFNHSTAVELDFPTHVQLLIDPKGKCFGIRACEKSDDNAVSFFTRPKDSKPYAITLNYQMAIEMIMNAMDWLDEKKYYTVSGQRFPDDKAIIFNLADADSADITKRASSDEE